MSKSKALKDFCKQFKNKKNNQIILTVSSKKLRKDKIDINDLLNSEIKNSKW